MGRASSGGDEGHTRDALNHLVKAIEIIQVGVGRELNTDEHRAIKKALDSARAEIDAIRVKGDKAREAKEE